MSETDVLMEDLGYALQCVNLGVDFGLYLDVDDGDVHCEFKSGDRMVDCSGKTVAEALRRAVSEWQTG